MSWLRISLISLVLMGCGFKPIYNERHSKYSLPSIYIENVEGQLGYLLKNKLEDNLFRSNTSAKNYSLRVNLNKISSPLTIQKENIVTYYNVVIYVSYELKSLLTDQVILSNNFKNISSYSTTNAEFANYIAEEDATNNNIEQISEKILTDINLYFQNN